MSRERQYTFLDQMVNDLDQGLRTLFGKPEVTERRNPASYIEETELLTQDRGHAAGLMRVNHAGEVCAQALYQGQALTARRSEVKDQMQRSAQEENDHLQWCESRLKELDSHTSRLNPIWFAGSFAIGAIAGLAGDKWSLGFVAETEHQVERHLNSHLESLPKQDHKSRAIVRQMREDEIEHGNKAMKAGGIELPRPIKKIMSITSKVLTTAAYRI